MDSDILDEFSDVTESLNIVSEEITDIHARFRVKSKYLFNFDLIDNKIEFNINDDNDDNDDSSEIENIALNLSDQMESSSCKSLKDIFLILRDIIFSENSNDIEYDINDDVDYYDTNANNAINNIDVQKAALRRKLELKEAELKEQIEKLNEKSPSNSRRINKNFNEVESFGILANDLLSTIGKENEFGFEIEPIDNSVYNWKVKINRFAFDSKINESFAEFEFHHGYSHVEFLMEFTMGLHPYYPPIVTMIRPRFEGSMLEKISSLPILSLQNW